MLQEKAKILQKSIDETSSCIASNGWLNRFKTLYDVRLLKITGEKLSSQPELVDPFKEKLRQIILDLGLIEDQIYIADETGLHLKLLPSKTYVSHFDKIAPGRETSKQRIKFLAYANVTGNHKLKPLFIGKSNKPRPFRNFNCPVHYRDYRTAWTTMQIYRKCFHDMLIREVTTFLQSRNLPIRALLLHQVIHLKWS